MKLVSTLMPHNWPGLRVLAHSLAHNGNITGLDWVVLTEDRAPDEWRDWLDCCGFRMDNLLLSEVGELPKNTPPTKGCWRFCYNKLRIFSLPAGEYLYLDVDMLCKKDATEILTTPSISAVMGRQGGWSSAGINTGLIRFDPGQEIVDACAEEMKAAVAEWQSIMADQGILRRVFRKHPEMIACKLGREWNTKAIPSPDLLEEAIFIHFAGEVKPWAGGKSIWADYAASILPNA